MRAASIALASGKPLMVILTQSYCNATHGHPEDCVASRRLKALVNRGTQVKKLLGSFVVALREGEAIEPWEAITGGETHVPQGLFFAPDGTQVAVQSRHDRYKNYPGHVAKEADVHSAMLQTLRKVARSGEL